MLVSYKWLQDYVDIPWTAQELAERLTMAGLEVESIEALDPGLSHVYTAEVTAIEPHTGADDLKVCTVSLGGSTEKVVCGAPNVRLGMKVVAALVGASLPGGIVEARTIRGVESRGMLCSEYELGLGEDASGLMELPNEVDIGELLGEALGLDDQVLDVAIYANRPDCMSMLGIAREAGALAETELRCPGQDLIESSRDITGAASVTVEDPELCPRYSARIIDGIELGPSPVWMQQRLRAAGMRPINNVVDITNFVMLETGQPLHAFDYDTLAEHRIVVRRARDGESFTTLDGLERTLTQDMLMICDAAGPVGIGGVMGGANTEVSDTTRTILLEAAYFSPVSVRRTARALGIASEAAARFEKGLDPQGTVYALDRAAQLLMELANGQVMQGVLDENTVSNSEHSIELLPQHVNGLLGTSIPDETMVSLLRRLQLAVDTTAIPWRVTVPSFRGDLELECDLIEEVARLYGFDQVPMEVPAQAITGGGQSTKLTLIDEVRDALCAAGLHEAMGYTFESRQQLVKLGLDTVKPWRDAIPLLNPLNEEFAVMRTTLLGGLLNAAARNAHRQQERVNLFEIGPVFHAAALPLDMQPEEKEFLGIVLMGNRTKRYWGEEPKPFDYFDVKGFVELVVSQFSAAAEFRRGDHPSFHPGRQADIVVDGVIVGRFGEVHPDIAAAFEVDHRVLAAEVDLRYLAEYPPTDAWFEPLPRYPAVERDMALILDDEVLVQDVLDVLQKAAGDTLRQMAVFDVYQGHPVPEGKRSVAFRFVFQGDRTLTDEEVARELKSMYTRVKEEFGAELR